MLANTDPDTIIDMSNSLEYVITSLNEEINEKVVKNSHDIDNLRNNAKSDMKVTTDVINFTFRAILSMKTLEELRAWFYL